MIIKIVRKKVPTMKTLHDGESVVVLLRHGQLMPESEGGLFLYTRVGKELFRTKLEQVEWEA